VEDKNSIKIVLIIKMATDVFNKKANDCKG